MSSPESPTPAATAPRLTPRVICIGMDGATFDVIKPWIAEGHLPALQALIARGAHGELRSTVQPLSPPAWASFYTGVNPGKHGIYNFYENKPETYEIRMINFKRCLSPTLWAHLSRLRKRVLVVNVPMTYPPEKVNGFFVAGFDTPSDDSEFTWPRDLRQTLQQQYQYKIDCYVRDYQGPNMTPEETMRNFSRDIIEVEKIRTRAMVDLLDKERFDFAMLTFTMTDRGAHHFFGPMVHKDPAVGHTLLEIYKAVDAGIAEIVRRADEQTTVLVVSDHGTCEFKRVFFLNNWLQQEGYLSDARSEAEKHGIPLKKKLKILAVIAARTLMPKPVRDLIKSRNAGLRQQLHKDLGASPILWDKTRAFAEHLSGNVFLNKRGVFGQGIVEPGAEYEQLAEEIRAKLAAVIDPATGKPLCTKVWRRDELYHGPATDKAPDILMELADGYEVVSDLSEGPASFRKKSRELFRTVDRGYLSGAHTHDGIFIAAGRGVKAGVEVKGANIVDIVPTVCRLLGVAPMPNLDGAPIADALALGTERRANG